MLLKKKKKSHPKASEIQWASTSRYKTKPLPNLRAHLSPAPKKTISNPRVRSAFGVDFRRRDLTYAQMGQRKNWHNFASNQPIDFKPPPMFKTKVLEYRGQNRYFVRSTDRELQTLVFSLRLTSRECASAQPRNITRLTVPERSSQSPTQTCTIQFSHTVCV